MGVLTQDELVGDKTKRIYICEHYHKHGTSYQAVLSSEEPSQEQMENLFDDFDPDDDEMLTCMPFSFEDIVDLG